MIEVPQNQAQRNQEQITLLTLIGSTLTGFNLVEEGLYQFFQKLLGIQNNDICSVLFFGPPSFESRRVLVNRIAKIALAKHPEPLKLWAGIFSDLETLASQRGSVAHYSLDYNIKIISLEPVKYEVGEPRLQPSEHNALLATKRTDEHAVTIAKMVGYVASFGEMQKRLKRLTFSVPHNPAPVSEGFLASLLRGLDPTTSANPSQEKPDPSTQTPSDPERRP